MNIILLRQNAQTPIRLSRRWVLILTATAAALLALVTGYGGFLWGQWQQAQDHAARAAQWQEALAHQREEVQNAKEQAQQGMDVLAARVGKLRGQVARLNALGARLVEMAELEEGEFDFTSPPALGGPERSAPADSVTEPDFVASLDVLAEKLDDRAQQLSVLETMLMNRRLHKEVMPAGEPVASGWVSSPFGMRTDPFTGERAWHGGLDVAGKDGTGVIAVATGVVTWSGERYGYGNMIEVNHGNGFVTRYGHNKKNLVSVGETVEQGQVIGRMGSSGRSTGPHVHFEVLRNGEPVDPAKYLRATR